MYYVVNAISSGGIDFEQGFAFPDDRKQYKCLIWNEQSLQ